MGGKSGKMGSIGMGVYTGMGRRQNRWIPIQKNGRKNGGKEERKEGRVEGRKDGRKVEGRKEGRREGRAPPPPQSPHMRIEGDCCEECLELELCARAVV